jgi:hypothetical protein
MTDQPVNIVPFGKHRGRLIGEVLVDDPQYTFVAGPVDVALAIVVGGTVVLAIALNILGLVSWLRRKP